MALAGHVDPATVAFRRVLADARAGEQGRVDALLALSQRTVYAATWPGPNQAARTLTNGHGESALPLFTGLDVLESCAERFGWRGTDGSLPFREFGAREALRHALVRGVHFVVMDIGAEHSVEFARQELEPLVQATRAGALSQPPLGNRQAALLDAVRRSTKPPRAAAAAPLTDRAIAPGMRDTLAPPSARGRARASSRLNLPALRAQAESALTIPPPSAATQPGGSVLSVNPLPDLFEPPANSQNALTEPPPPSAARGLIRDDEPTLAERTGNARGLGISRAGLSDTMLQGLCGGLRGFPEVEWACVLSDGSEIPLIGVRVDPSFLNRVADITDAIMDVADKYSAQLQVLLLNNQELVKNARRFGKTFYPWQG
jgi:hypothetical protein